MTIVQSKKIKGIAIMNQSVDFRLAFMDILNFEDGSMRAGLLITNLATHPYEFRTTNSIKPTTFQQLLYGVTLKDYLYGELIGLPLVRSVKEKIDILLVREKKLLSIRPSVAFPILMLYQEGNVTQGHTLSTVVHEEYPHDENSLPYIAEIGDISEPFDRVRVALKEIQRIRPEEKIAHG